MFRRLVVVAGLVAFTVAQSVSQQCANAFTSIAANPAASQCLAIGALLPVITAGSNTSLVQPLNNWLTSMCGAPACSNATLAAVMQNLTTGCSTELSAAGISPDSVASLTTTVESLYPTVRKIACLKDGSTLCLTETLTNVESVTGPLTIANIVKIVENPPTSLPTNITCTDCNKEAYNIWAQDQPSTASSAKSALESQCGSSFVDGATPTEISESANTSAAASNSSSTKSPAFSLLDTLTSSVAMAVGASGFITLSTVYTLLI